MFTPSATANTSSNVLGRLDFLRNLKDPIHDSTMGINATQPSSIRLAVDSSASSTSRSRFRTQAHHLRQVLARYPFIHSEKFDLHLSPTKTQLPPRDPNAESGTTWVHTAVGVYAPVRLHIVPPPSSLFKFIRPVARWDMELNRELTGERGRRCVVNIRCSRPIPLLNLFFCCKDLDLTFVVLTHPLRCAIYLFLLLQHCGQLSQ